MPISKKTIECKHAHSGIINNQQLADIGEYNNILAIARQESINIVNTAQEQANNLIEDANEQLSQTQQQALDLLQQVEAQNNAQIAETQAKIDAMLSEATGSVQDIIDNSEQTTSKAVWANAQDLIAKLEQERIFLYDNTQQIIKSILSKIVHKITVDLDTQSKLHILAGQIFDKAREVELATLYFSAKDFADLPQFNIPQGWKVDKDMMLESGSCRLVGAGGEWKTSINIIERKILTAIECDEIVLEPQEYPESTEEKGKIEDANIKI
jgi:HrpE/YscL/FliH and V-type ATPase subunit E